MMFLVNLKESNNREKFYKALESIFKEKVCQIIINNKEKDDLMPKFIENSTINSLIERFESGDFVYCYENSLTGLVLPYINIKISESTKYAYVLDYIDLPRNHNTVYSLHNFGIELRDIATILFSEHKDLEYLEIPFSSEAISLKVEFKTQIAHTGVKIFNSR